MFQRYYMQKRGYCQPPNGDWQKISQKKWNLLLTMRNVCAIIQVLRLSPALHLSDVITPLYRPSSRAAGADTERRIPSMKRLSAILPRRATVRVHPGRSQNARSAVSVSTARPERTVDFRSPAFVRHRRGRDLLHQVDVHGSIQPRPRAAPVAHRQSESWQCYGIRSTRGLMHTACIGRGRKTH